MTNYETRIKKGKTYLVLHPGDKFYKMGHSAGNGETRLVARARAVVSERLNRPLKSSEDVHHKDENKMNDEIKNLQLLSKSEHAKIEKLKRVIKFFQKLLKEAESAGISFDKEN